MSKPRAAMSVATKILIELSLKFRKAFVLAETNPEHESLEQVDSRKTKNRAKRTQKDLPV